ncbi:MAG: hypothetical protein K0R05_1673 [Anaerocolumna sp.]|nr:hypothetical protein [Anaerocolumna sp.]
MKYLILLFIILLIIYEKVWRKHICKKKIYKHIKRREGDILSIEKLSLRDEVFKIVYTIDGQSENSIVKFNFFYKETWM